MLLLIAALLIFTGYLLVADALPGGQSVGKRIWKLSVVDAATGAPCTVWQSFVRNIFFLILGGIEWMVIFGEDRQRLGDKAAKTLVIKLPSVHASDP
jgi:uncharacterized RDD family membrane protein YckC